MSLQNICSKSQVFSPSSTLATLRADSEQKRQVLNFSLQTSLEIIEALKSGDTCTAC